MSIEENKEITLRYFSGGANEYKQSKESEGKDVHTPEFVFHSLAGDMNLKEYLGLMDVNLTAFPDFKYSTEDIIAEGDKVVCRYTFTGTHQGDYMGVPASGKKVKNEGIGIIRISDGRIVEAWFAGDMLTMMQQIGAIPQQ